MDIAVDIFRWIHVALGGVGLVLFWIPIFATKGGKVHVRFGRYFVWCAYGVTATALLVSAFRLIEPLDSVPPAVHIFLAYLAIVTFGFVRQAVLTTRTRRDPSKLTADKWHHALGVLCILSSITVIVVGLVGDSGTPILLLALSPIGFVAGGGILTFRRNPAKTPRAWWYAHIAAILGAGIAFHTAFLVFGGGRLIKLPGALQVVPWLLPTIIGVPAIFIWVGHYKKKFGEA